MASDSSGNFGFELLQKSVGEGITRKDDLLLLLTHWHLLKHGFRCIGLGESKVIRSSDVPSELLPNGWNSSPNYNLRYVRDGNLFLFYGIKTELAVIFNLLRVDDQRVSNVQIPLSSVNEGAGNLPTMIPNHKEILYSMTKSLVEPVCATGTREIETQTVPTSSDDQDRSMRYHQMRVRPEALVDDEPRGMPYLERNVGRNDLEPPFAPIRQGGGMLFDPFLQNLRQPLPGMPGLGVPGRLPPGAVPPGARFDPFGPPEVVGPPPRHNPDHDHLPAPGFDDMYM